jgi:hypothetical protein
MQKIWWRTLAVRRVRHKLFISASRHFLLSDRWPSSFKACLSLSGCGLAAFPCRLSSGIVKIVPVVGHPAAAPLDACADFIDPG